MTDDLDRHIKESGEEIDQIVAGLFEAIERLHTGNPRLTKPERESFKRFLNAVIGHLTVTYANVQGLNTLRLKDKVIGEMNDTALSLHDQAEHLLTEGIKQIGWLIERGRTDDALELVARLTRRRDG